MLWLQRAGRPVACPKPRPTSTLIDSNTLLDSFCRTDGLLGGEDACIVGTLLGGCSLSYHYCCWWASLAAEVVPLLPPLCRRQPRSRLHPTGTQSQLSWAQPCNLPGPP